MEHLDQPAVKLLSNVLQGQATIRFNMVTEVTDAWKRMMGWRMDNALGMATSGYDGLVFHRFSIYNAKRARQDQFRKGYRISSVKDGWCFMADTLPEKPLTLKEHMAEAKLSPHLATDMIRLDIETPTFETEKGYLYHSEQFHGWLYDPKNHFWPKGD